jgi:hypothetical protein
MRGNGEDCGVRLRRRTVERWRELCGIARLAKMASLMPDTALRRFILNQLILGELRSDVGGELYRCFG